MPKLIRKPKLELEPDNKVIINENVDLYIGDCIDEMKKMSDQSIDLIVTSPPYWGQRDYNNDKQWGNEEEVKDYIDKMTIWGKECYRILKNTGSLFLNIGDKYSKKGLKLISFGKID